ncbi:MAG: LamG-like jellyroll fold domain-containing protein [Phycisphaerae bacterium]
MKTIQMLSAVLVLAGLFCSSCTARGEAQSETSDATKVHPVREFVDSRVRMTWIRNRDGRHSLVLWDTDDNQGLRELKLKVNPSRPMITPSGKRVVFIDYDKWASYVIDWDGTGLEKLTDGRVTYVRRDEQGREWIYFQTRDNEIRTARLDRPDQSSRVWKFDWKPRKGKSTNFQTSADGKVAGATFPWPHNGLTLLNGAGDSQFVKYGTGCWPQIARDNSYRFFHCVGGKHMYLAMYSPERRKGWHVRVKPNPEGEGCECPRWSNDTRYFIATDRPAARAAVYIGRFSDDFTRVEKWLTVETDGSNASADMWVERAANRPVKPADKPLALRPPSETRSPYEWPGTQTEIRYLWQNTSSDNRMNPGDRGASLCTTAAKGSSRPDEFGGMNLTGGYLLAEGVSETLLKEVVGEGAITFEATITPTSWKQSGVLMEFGPETGSANFTVRQYRDKLIVQVRAGSSVRRLAVDPGELPDNKAVHLMVSAGQKAGLAVFVNGKQVHQSKRPLGQFDGWKAGRLVIGSDTDGKSDWSGSVEGVAVYSRFIPLDEAREKYSLYRGTIKKRKPLPRTVVQATLAEVTKVPRPEEASNYPRCLIVNRYKVQKVVDGKVKGESIYVAHWGLLDRRQVDVPQKLGETARLTLIDFASVPGLQMEQIINHTEEFDPSPLYLAVPE